MTFLSGPPIRPQVGGFYNLRAGLTCFIDGVTDLYGEKFYRGVILPPSVGRVLWYNTGSYSPVPGARHELDIMEETAC
jgi:hypothetical protein